MVVAEKQSLDRGAACLEHRPACTGQVFLFSPRALFTPASTSNLPQLYHYVSSRRQAQASEGHTSPDAITTSDLTFAPNRSLVQAPKKERSDEDEETIAFKAKRAQEEKALKDARDKGAPDQAHHPTMRVRSDFGFAALKGRLGLHTWCMSVDAFVQAARREEGSRSECLSSSALACFRLPLLVYSRLFFRSGKK